MGNVDALVAESQRLRDELLRTAARLDAFCEQLNDAVTAMGGGECGDGSRDQGSSDTSERID